MTDIRVTVDAARLRRVLARFLAPRLVREALAELEVSKREEGAELAVTDADRALARRAARDAGLYVKAKG